MINGISRDVVTCRKCNFPKIRNCECDTCKAKFLEAELLANRVILNKISGLVSKGLP